MNQIPFIAHYITSIRPEFDYRMDEELRKNGIVVVPLYAFIDIDAPLIPAINHNLSFLCSSLTS